MRFGRGVGAALSVIHGTGPLTTNEYYADNMKYTSAVISKMAELGGARCCKRNAFLSLSTGARFVREHYGIPHGERRDRLRPLPEKRPMPGQKMPLPPDGS